MLRASLLFSKTNTFLSGVGVLSPRVFSVEIPSFFATVASSKLKPKALATATTKTKAKAPAASGKKTAVAVTKPKAKVAAKSSATTATTKTKAKAPKKTTAASEKKTSVAVAKPKIAVAVAKPKVKAAAKPKAPKEPKASKEPKVKEKWDRSLPPIVLYNNEMIKTFATQWGGIPPEEKKVYEEIAAKDKARFEVDAKKFFQDRGMVQYLRQKLPEYLKKHDPLHPPALPLAPYQNYVRSRLLGKPTGIPAKVAMAQIGVTWKSLTPTEQEVYSKQTEEQKKAFSESWATFKSQVQKLSEK